VIDIKDDLEEALAGFKWEVIGLLLEDQRVIDVPSDSRAISAQVRFFVNNGTWRE